ncbi:hypothetical protein GQ53DRAFT_857406 [Thozetella sp. PMI_491]|nr:hypothetical protein GQ53DRAFT_857406 [Thozetella sp. PMI_491]
MAQARETRQDAFNLSSPHSSPGRADSYKHEGTPDTRLTAFSPDESSARSIKVAKAMNAATSSDTRPHFSVQPTGTAYRTGISPAGKDPFVSTGSIIIKADQKLSPTASAFQPLSVSSLAIQDTVPLAGDSVPADYHASSDAARYQAVRLSQQLGLSRCLVVESQTQAISSTEIHLYLSICLSPQWAARCKGKCHMHDINGKTYIRLTHINDAINICDMLMKREDGGQGNEAKWDIRYYAPSEFSQIVSNGIRVESDYEGQISVVALPQHHQPHLGLNTRDVEARLTMLFAVDDIFAFQPQHQIDNNVIRAIIEFCDIEVANEAVSKFNGSVFEDFQVILNPHKPDLATQQTHAEIHTGVPQLSGGIPFGRVASLLQDMTLASKYSQLGRGVIDCPRGLPSPSGYQSAQLPEQLGLYHNMLIPGQGRFSIGSIPYLIDPYRGYGAAPPVMSNVNLQMLGPAYATSTGGSLMAIHNDYPAPRRCHGVESRRQNATRVHRSGYYNAASHHNHVDVNRIRDGIDVRTTIMLRNIPNKVDQAMLKRIVDESSWGKYDFMYLRIDFANDCNVGYAFINFVDPLDIIDFVNARGNQRWNCFKSDKVAEISYATIQGKDCLVQKFRNSSVMLEASHYRPKLYYTTNGPMRELAGQEEPFPEPDNHSKMKRSCENAEHVGLFTPNAGQHFRDEQRRRRSQYDRGTRLAALEECDYEFQPRIYGPQ